MKTVELYSIWQVSISGTIATTTNIKFIAIALPKDVRADIQRRWMDGYLPVICATISFGMGIDKGSVRYV